MLGQPQLQELREAVLKLLPPDPRGVRVARRRERVQEPKNVPRRASRDVAQVTIGDLETINRLTTTGDADLSASRELSDDCARRLAPEHPRQRITSQLLAETADVFVTRKSDV